MPDEAQSTPVDPATVRLESLAPPAGAKHPRKRLGRGPGSGLGKTCGRGHKGAGARSGSKSNVTRTGGQMPLHMQKGKLRGPNHKKSMPMGPHRTFTVPVNVGQLAVFEAGAVVDVQMLEARGLVKNNANRAWPVKILAQGELDRALTVRAHAFSATARAKIEAAGGTAEVIGEEPAAAGTSGPSGATLAESPAPALADATAVDQGVGEPDAAAEPPEAE